MKKACNLSWRAAKGMTLALVFSEVNLISIPKDMWRVDSGATLTYVCQCRVASITGGNPMKLKS